MPGPCLSRSEARPSCCNSPSSSTWQQFPRGFEIVQNCDPPEDWAITEYSKAVLSISDISDQVVPLGPLKHVSTITGYNWHPMA